ncbi:isoprenoid synthase domain-containing protein [Multifurca ochricompacta]|uniref:(2E,6E)-farnesyl diphosphate synthase n=1 Tax=Multifurca ochricompacta TaxID=376703 RepID=A0AAD4MEQ7_9AGAM|nr:isoprenoid synthase domain-containing protein [Multifurca ochricompacta]
MLVLATLHRLLSQVISSPGLHTAVLLTPNGQLVSYACDSTKSKDDVRLVVGLSSEIWLEVADQGVGMVDSELGRILVLGVQDTVATPHSNKNNDTSPTNSANTDQASDKPLMLVALSATEAVGWEDLEAKSALSEANMRRWPASHSIRLYHSWFQFRPYSAPSLAQKPAHATPLSPARAILHESSPPSRPDPYLLLKPQLDHLREKLLNLLGSAHPTLNDIAKYYFLHPSKQLRPLLILLFSQATNGLGRDWDLKKWAAECEGAGGRGEELDRPLTRPDVLNDWNPSMPDHTASFASIFSLIPPRAPKPPPSPPPRRPASELSTFAHDAPLLPTQTRLAQIIEMIHVASLLHDDVIDHADLRRGAASAPAAFGNKYTILGGDFLLGRASAALSRLGESEVVELIAGVITNLVEGEILQMNKVAQQSAALVGASHVGSDSWNIYLRKTYLKTASLMAKGARAAVVLGGGREGEVWKEVAYAYGRNLGIAFQLVDDVLDYESGEAALGKPGGADLQLGLATGPALYAWEEHPEMGSLIARKFEKEGDVELARELVRRSSGVERTRELARAYADKALETLEHLPESEARSALEVLTERVVKRTW